MDEQGTIPSTGWTAGRRNRLLLVTSLIVLAVVALWSARNALFPYVFALVLAYMVLPAVNRLDHWLHRVFPNLKYTRPLAITLVYFLMAGLVALFLMLALPIMGQQFARLWENREALIAKGQELTGQGLYWYHENVPQAIQTQLEDTLRQTAGTIVRAVQTSVARTLAVVTSTISFVLALLVVPFWLFYILNDQSEVAAGVKNLVPERWRTDAFNLARITDDILSAYIRGQFLLCIFVGGMATIGLTLLGVQFSAILGLISAVTEIIPFLGPILGLIPAILVASTQSPLLALWTLLLYLAIQQVENLLLVPRISGAAVQLHPALIMVVLVLGSEMGGLVGLVLAVPLTAIIRDLFKYLYLRFQDEPLTPQEAMKRLGRTPLQLDV